MCPALPDLLPPPPLLVETEPRDSPMAPTGPMAPGARTDRSRRLHLHRRTPPNLSKTRRTLPGLQLCPNSTAQHRTRARAVPGWPRPEAKNTVPATTEQNVLCSTVPNRSSNSSRELLRSTVTASAAAPPTMVAAAPGYTVGSAAAAVAASAAAADSADGCSRSGSSSHLSCPSSSVACTLYRQIAISPSICDSAFATGRKKKRGEQEERKRGCCDVAVVSQLGFCCC